MQGKTQKKDGSLGKLNSYFDKHTSKRKIEKEHARRLAKRKATERKGACKTKKTKED